MLFDLVINTRPAHKNLELQKVLTDFEVLSLPALSLSPLDFELPADWQNNDFIFFVSQFAVDSFFAKLATEQIAWPTSLYAAAVGQVSADALIAHGVELSKVLVATSGDSDSEAFLAWFEANYQVPERVMIVRAQHGRNWLNEQLQQRDIQTTFLAVYQRGPAIWTEQQKQPLLALLDRKPKARICWLLTSRESVDAIVQQWLEEPTFSKLCWNHDFLVFHPRIAEHLEQKQAQYAPSLEKALSVHLTQPDNTSILATLKGLE
ncbi:MAG: uroporphyrinogen-III synthase [Alcaligenaceae bacterium]|nr:uroporphyrinogen-III synthase [Alcaligenaceae bacterium]